MGLLGNCTSHMLWGGAVWAQALEHEECMGLPVAVLDQQWYMGQVLLVLEQQWCTVQLWHGW